MVHKSEILCFITSYDRKEMLADQVEAFTQKGIKTQVMEDGVTFEFRGKQKYWVTWHQMLKYCKDHPHKMYVFIPDDFQRPDIDKMIEIHNHFDVHPYVHNIINDGREFAWDKLVPKETKQGSHRVGFADCGFFCNHEALKATGFRIRPVDFQRWQRNKTASSGVGRYLSRRFMLGGVKVWTPENSLAYHGTHESKMHPELRKTNPIISK
jgi:hypothetical protein